MEVEKQNKNKKESDFSENFEDYYTLMESLKAESINETMNHTKNNFNYEFNSNDNKINDTSEKNKCKINNENKNHFYFADDAMDVIDYEVKEILNNSQLRNASE